MDKICIDFFGTIIHFLKNVLNPFVLKLLLKKAFWKHCSVYKSSTGLPSVPGAKYKLSKFGHPQKIKVWLFGFKQDTAALTITFAFFLHCLLHFSCRFCYFTFWCDRFLEKLLRILRVHEGSSYSLDFSGQLILLNMFFFCIFLQPVVTESWMVWKIFSIVPVRWQSGTMDKDPNGRKLGTPPYNNGHSNPPLIMATSLVRQNSYGLIVATLEGSLLLS